MCRNDNSMKEYSNQCSWDNFAFHKLRLLSFTEVSMPLKVFSGPC